MGSELRFREGRFIATRLKRFAVPVLLIITLVGCGPKLHVVNEDASFGTTETYTRPVAVGGVVWNAGEVERGPEVCAVLEATLRERLLKDISGDRVRELQWVADNLDSTDRRLITESFRATGNIDSLASNRLHDMLGDSSVLIVFGRVLRDEIDTTRHSASNKNEKDWDEIQRSVSMSLLVFDASRGRTVWQAEVSNRKSKAEDVDDGDFSLGGFIAEVALTAIVSAILDDDEEEPPPVLTTSPELVKIVWGLYGQVSKKLVAKEK